MKLAVPLEQVFECLGDKYVVNSLRFQSESKLKQLIISIVSVAIWGKIGAELVDILGHFAIVFALLGGPFLIDAYYAFDRHPAQHQISRSAPGHIFLFVSEFLFSRRVYNTVIAPTVLDMREEYFEALSQNRIWKARWVRVRGTWSFFAAMGLDRAFSLVSLCVKVWKSVN